MAYPNDLNPFPALTPLSPKMPNGENMPAQRTGFSAFALGPIVHPLEREYGPLDAALISAGRSFDTTWNQLKQGYYLATPGWRDRLQQQALLNALRQQRTENAPLYQPLTQAYPIITAFGEAAPALLGGPKSLIPAVTSNVVSRSAQEALRALESDTGPGTEKARALAKALLGLFPQ